MKALRWFTIVLLIILVVSTWAPAPVYAKSSSSTSLAGDLAGTPLAQLRVTNHTGGTLYVRFSGSRGYSFSTSSQGRTTFDRTILPGKYVITVTASACSGQLTYRKNVKGGTVSLPPMVCRHK